MILVFGSVNVDVIVPVPLLPAPGETVLGGDYALLPGGKGANQALAARRAGAEVTLAAAVGSDPFAELALAGLRADGVDLSPVRRVARPTGVAAIVVDAGGENLIAVAPGANRDAAAAGVADALLGPATLVLCQMEVPAAETWQLLHRAAAAGAATMLNLAPAAPLDPDSVGLIDIVVANAGEAATLGDPSGLARRLRRALVITSGRDGATALLAQGGEVRVPALPLAAVDTTGAGDTFVGVLAAWLDPGLAPGLDHGLDRGLALDLALRHASAAAGLACLAHGAQSAMPNAAAIEEAMQRPGW